MNLNKALPEWHFEKLMKIISYLEQKEAQTQNKKALVEPITAKLLPNLSSFEFKIPYLLILLDQDIKNMWQEELSIKEQLSKIRTVNNAIIERVYKEYLHSDAGKHYQLSSINSKFKMVDVCYSCYKLYEELSKEIISERGMIKM